MRFKYRAESDYYVLIKEGDNLRAVGSFNPLEYTEFAKIKEEPHNYSFDDASGKLKHKRAPGNTSSGTETQRDSQPVTNPLPIRHSGVTLVNRPSGSKTSGEGGSSGSVV